MTERSQTRQDLELAARRLVGGTGTLASGAASTAKSAGPALGILAVLTAFLYGRRRGRRRSAQVKVSRKK